VLQKQTAPSVHWDWFPRHPVRSTGVCERSLTHCGEPRSLVHRLWFESSPRSSAWFSKGVYRAQPGCWWRGPAGYGDTAACHHDNERSGEPSYDPGAGGFVPDSFETMKVFISPFYWLIFCQFFCQTPILTVKFILVLRPIHFWTHFCFQQWSCFFLT